MSMPSTNSLSFSTQRRDSYRIWAYAWVCEVMRLYDHIAARYVAAADSSPPIWTMQSRLGNAMSINDGES